jgi:hypothetical protein
MRAQAAVRAALEHAGRLDVVVNAAGVVAFGTVNDLSIDVMEELFLTNTFLPIMLAKAALPHLAEGGAIVNLSGVIAEQNLPGMAAYGASKAAVRSFDEALAREARRRQVRVLDARPPHTETGLADHPLEGTAPRYPGPHRPAPRPAPHPTPHRPAPRPAPHPTPHPHRGRGFPAHPRLSCPGRGFPAPPPRTKASTGRQTLRWAPNPRARGRGTGGHHQRGVRPSPAADRCRASGTSHVPVTSGHPLALAGWRRLPSRRAVCSVSSLGHAPAAAT